MIGQYLQYVSPAMIMIIGSALLPATKSYARMAVALLLPIITLAQIWNVVGINIGEGMVINLGQFILRPIYVHQYTLIFSTAFAVVAFAAALYSVLQSRCSELVSAFIYSGSAIGVCFSGDLITLAVYWEIMAIAATVVIFSSKEEFAGKAGVRYAIMHFFGGVILVAGIIGQISLSGSSGLIPFAADVDILFPLNALDMNGVITWLLLLGLLVNVAVPPFSAWLPDAYPKASPGGAVFLSAFTTKTAVFVLMTLFAGTTILIFIGVFMMFYGIIYAILENDMRRILSYSMITQLGFMLVGVGVGTELSLNGVAAYAFCHIMYNALLFMSAGSVLYMTGKNKCTELGGLYNSMKLTTICAIIGSLSMLAMPLTASFVSKPLIFDAVVDEELSTIWFSLFAASAGIVLQLVFLWFVFFQKDSGMRPNDPPLNMRLGMLLLSALCIIPAIPGITGKVLYSMLPSVVEYKAYTAEHIAIKMQVVLFSCLAFVLMLPLLKRSDSIILDFDWFYRRFGRYIVLVPIMVSKVPLKFFRIVLKKGYRKVYQIIDTTYGPGGVMARSWTIGATAMWVMVLLGVYLVVCYLSNTITVTPE